jgi:ceramide glucosyltransferase
MIAGLQVVAAHSEVYCFIDDDIALRPGALCQFLSHVKQPGVGAVFGLACAVSWDSLWSGLMSLFVNSNALLSYVPLTYLLDPFTITGHYFAIPRQHFEAADGLNSLSRNVGDDAALARQLRRIGLGVVQAPVIYNVANALPHWGDYAGQLKRWFVFPRQVVLPYLTRRESLISSLLSLDLFLPSLSLLLALINPRPRSLLALGLVLLIFISLDWLCERRYRQRATPLWGWLLLPLVACITPLQILWALLLAGPEIVWRGRRLKIAPGGEFEVLP